MEPNAAQLGAFVPQSVLEGGSENADILLGAIRRRMDDMAPGQILHVVTHDPSLADEMAEWCRVRAHEVVNLLIEGGIIQCWIRKGEEMY